MEQNANAEKQARHRKKDQLRRRADQLLRKWQLEPWKHHLKSMAELHDLLEAAIKLPSGWTEEDFFNAEKKLYHVYSEVVSPVNQLSADLRENRNLNPESICSFDLPKINADLLKAEENSRALASHLISALKLSSCNEADQAAALMEAMRFVGRTLANKQEVSCSGATAMCLATVNPIYARPDWFAKKMADTLSQQIHTGLSNEIGKYLVK